ncbi:hypothetical protein CC1G_08889 [Coprinopsis cinerea okayama7|uniref:Uncharacterized protein n=1 Tax=Coprinopsis cinerea (strain Okayama-7 / 130 / ATCC MYA-4618 / FGSC 9003) TaxID=240176 RepID=A8P869_COPC7|nr:hypothetical protein CC1G_08889 [Coprinopsis cinerea okayama7\|eukprot:XP_001839510.2 hypothetical protein CC1G_08889 [Coprinopsis cinerea okayama7\
MPGLVTMGGNIAYTITYLQTCAIWRRKRCIVIPLLFVLIGKVLVSIVLIHLHLEAIIWDTDPEPVGKCKGIARTKYPRYIYLSVFISETFTIGLTLVKAFEHVRQSGSSWVHQLYKNGILYSVCVLLLSILNAVMPFVSPVHSGIFVRPQRVMESVLCSRIVFVILKQQRRRYSTSFHDDNFYYYNGGSTGSLFSTLSGPRDIFTSAFGFVGTGTRTVPATVGLSGPPIADTARRKQGEIVSNRSTRSSVEWEMQVLDHDCGRRED